jgi:hypothetical protein
MTLILRKGASKEEIKKINTKLSKSRKNKKGFDAFKYCGVIELTEDPLTIQKRLRDEWE